MPVIAWSRSLTPERAAELGVEYKATPADVARDADIVSVHVALNADTRGFLGADFFAAMREGAYFINTARGEVVDQAALIEAHESRAEFAPDLMSLPASRLPRSPSSPMRLRRKRIFTARITSALQPIRRRKRLPRRRSGSCASLRKREKFRTL